MTGAVLKFENGYLGIERCQDPNDGGKQFLRAMIYSNASGRVSSAFVSNEDVQQFALDVMKQAVLAQGYSEDDIINMSLERILKEIEAENAAATRQ